MPYCPNCGENIGKTFNFCTKCGFDLKAEEAVKVQPELSSYTTKCAIHPKRDAVGTCVDCGRGVCVLCRTVAGDKLYCPSCIDLILSRPVERTGTTSQEAFAIDTSKKLKKPVKKAATLKKRGLVSVSGEQGVDPEKLHKWQAEELIKELNRGGKFVIFEYCISIIIMTFKQPSDIYFIKSGQGTFKISISYTLASLLLGWWGLPWGPIYTIESLVTNFRGGKNVTNEVLAYLGNISEV